jgi:predicted RND superfamily exporter protein
MLVYIIGVFLCISCLPLVFLLPLSDPKFIFAFAIIAKIGIGMMIISQLTIIPKITLNRNRRVFYILKSREN